MIAVKLLDKKAMCVGGPHLSIFICECHAHTSMCLKITCRFGHDYWKSKLLLLNPLVRI